MTTITGRWLVEGPIHGRVLRLDEPLSFWGGFDAATGCVIDRTHPQLSASLTGKVVAMPGARGSSGSPGVLGESIRAGTGPFALMITHADINLVAGALTAETLYGKRCPILLIDDTVFAALYSGELVQARPL